MTPPLPWLELRPSNRDFLYSLIQEGGGSHGAHPAEILSKVSFLTSFSL
jgi:hypothetical protein